MLLKLFVSLLESFSAATRHNRLCCCAADGMGLAACLEQDGRAERGIRTEAMEVCICWWADSPERRSWACMALRCRERRRNRKGKRPALCAACEWHSGIDFVGELASATSVGHNACPGSSTTH